jgi:hypothetical protein
MYGKIFPGHTQTPYKAYDSVNREAVTVVRHIRLSLYSGKLHITVVAGEFEFSTCFISTITPVSRARFHLTISVALLCPHVNIRTITCVAHFDCWTGRKRRAIVFVDGMLCLFTTSRAHRHQWSSGTIMWILVMLSVLSVEGWFASFILLHKNPYIKRLS